MSKKRTNHISKTTLQHLSTTSSDKLYEVWSQCYQNIGIGLTYNFSSLNEIDINQILSGVSASKRCGWQNCVGVLLLIGRNEV